MPDTQRPLVMMSGLVTRKAFDDEILDAFSRRTGVAVEAVFDPTVQLLRRIEAGERFDVLIGATTSFDALIANGVVAPKTRPFLRTGLGLAVAPGAPHPAIASTEDVVAALTSARSVAYSRTGQSGIYFVQLVERLGIEEAVLSKATVLEKGFTATALLSGDADLAVQQLSELMYVPEAEIVGPLPEGVQKWTEFAVGVAGGSVGDRVVDAFVDYITGPLSAPAYRASALEPIG